PLHRARACEDAGERVVAFVARRLVDLIRLLVKLRQRQLDRPRTREGGGVFDGDAERQQIGSRSCVTLDQRQVLGGTSIVGLVRKVIDFDHERLPVPEAARVSQILPRSGGKMGCLPTGMTRWASPTSPSS